MLISVTRLQLRSMLYLPDFGIRLEVDVFVGDREARVTGEVQDKLVLI